MFFRKIKDPRKAFNECSQAEGTEGKQERREEEGEEGDEGEEGEGEEENLNTSLTFQF